MEIESKDNKYEPVKQIRKQMPEHKSLDTRIKDLMAEGPLVALYFTTGINILKEQIDIINDEEVASMFGGLLHPVRVRGNVDYIYKVLNNLK